VRLFSRSTPRLAADTAWSFALPRPDFVAGSYEGRTFLSPPNHLGEDSEHAHHDPIHAIADGVVRDSCKATGYGRVVVVEHRLPDGSHVCSIYGHLCGHSGYPLIRDGAVVKKGDVVGYIGDRDENGDGLEHLHLGLRKGSYDGHFCGYARSPHCTPKHYHPPTAFIRARGGAMRLTVPIESFPMAPGGRELAFKASVANGFFYGGAFEFRLRVLAGNAGEAVRFVSAAQTRKLERGAAGSVLFATPLTDAQTPPAVVELRAPGTAAWYPVE
jgi:murein DD-endopeptidase MepM/ murein hydrolase activator NlpD